MECRGRGALAVRQGVRLAADLLILLMLLKSLLHVAQILEIGQETLVQRLGRHGVGLCGARPRRDSRREANETFYLDLFGTSGNSLLMKNRGIGTILNDD